MKFASRLTAVGASMALLSASLVVPAQAATAAPADDNVIINEAYTNGGSANAAFTHKFVELHNPTDADISLDGWSIQYRPATGEAAPSGVIELSGTITAGGYYLVQGSSNGDNGEALPAVDATGGVSFSGTNGTLVLANQTEKVSLPVGSVTAETEVAGVVDLLGYGTSNTYETATATGPAANNDPKSMTRTNSVDTDDNSADFTASESVTPTNAAGETAGGGTGEPEPEIPTEVTPIAEIQGTGAASEMVGQHVMTQGVVTAVYSTGGFNGYYLQTAGSGGDQDATPGASDAIFVYSTGTVGEVALGDHVQVIGEVSEYYTGTQLTVGASGMEKLEEPAEAVKPTTVEFPADEETKEAHEGMLIDPSGMEWTITDNYDVNSYGSLGLAPGTAPLDNPTSVAAPGEAAQAVMAENAEALIVLDDGASTDFMRSPGNQNKLPYLDIDDPVRVGSAVTFTDPVILDYRYESWNFQPTQHLTHENADEVQPATFENTRAAEATPEDVGGNVQLASFNVLNYFTTLGEEFDDCEAYEDHEGNPIATDFCEPRGAYNVENFLRQQEKIVAAINGLDASVVALEEIENSAAFGNDRDESLAALVAALNEAAGAEKWAYAESPAEIPADEDVIRNAFIYQPAAVETVGESTILTDSDAFSNAREPLAQTFRAVGEDGGIEGTEFVAITNHFKSKGSGSGAGNEDNGDGQGNSNADRVAQAEALVDFAEDQKTSEGTDRVFLMGDFNAYEKEDPIVVLEDAGYVSQGAKAEGEYSYTFDAAVGSLDGIYASASADETVTGSDFWMINANESVALEYSRYNYTPEQLYRADQWRSSDHNPLLVGIQLGEEQPGEPGPVEDFSDNLPGSVYYAPVRWMQSAGVTTGYADGTYRKGSEITRGESVAFLQRYLAPGYSADPAVAVFPDVPVGAPHFTPIAWAADEENQVTTGYADRTFRPGHDVTRSEFVTFLYRAAGPEDYTAPAESAFEDVPATGTHYEAISWAASEGLINGYTDGLYKPYDPINRGEVAKVMYQYDLTTTD
ncbi:ExeM/NucH family extracellular endonuclease [Citricoccus nitrophenolicus]|uniref:ExeM/NucH family extracellular endonuclease n=1 Tax=Citricoccus nitrophenolicus TaxID=863575 RepID=A0ABV0IH37_9MICC